MSSITTITVGANAQPLSPGPVAGATADTVTIVNLDTAASVNLGSQSSQLNLMLGPLASVTLTAPVWAAAVTTDLKIGVLPGGSNYSPGSLTITGPVTATITGTVAVDVQGTADINVTNADINVVGDGGFINPGAYDLILQDTSVRTVAPGGTYITPVFDVRNYQSYTVSLESYCTAQNNLGAPLCIPVSVSYYADAAASVLIDTETWWMWVASTAVASAESVLHGSGSLEGGYMTLSVGNPVGSEPLTSTNIVVYGAGRGLTGSQWQQASPSAIISGITILTSTAPLVPMPGDDKILANESSNTLPSTATYWLPLPLFSGTVSLRFLASATPAHDFIVCTGQGLQNGDVVSGISCQGIVWNVSTPLAEDETTIEVGNCPLFLVISTSGTGLTFSFSAEGTRP